MVAYLATYKPNVVSLRKRGRPRKSIQDMDTTKTDEVIHDQVHDGLRGKIKPRTNK